MFLNALPCIDFLYYVDVDKYLFIFINDWDIYCTI